MCQGPAAMRNLLHRLLSPSRIFMFRILAESPLVTCNHTAEFLLPPMHDLYVLPEDFEVMEDGVEFREKPVTVELLELEDPGVLTS
jgi:hypothetical protein